MLEVLMAIVLFSFASVITVDLFIAFSARITFLARAQRSSQGPQHILSAFVSALNRASQCAVYPDRKTYLMYPFLGGTAGDFAVVWMEDGSTVAFELSQNELRILENPGTPIARERLWAAGISAPNGLISWRKGALTLGFSARIGSTYTDFFTSGRVASAR